MEQVNLVSKLVSVYIRSSPDERIAQITHRCSASLVAYKIGNQDIGLDPVV